MGHTAIALADVRICYLLVYLLMSYAYWVVGPVTLSFCTLFLASRCSPVSLKLLTGSARQHDLSFEDMMYRLGITHFLPLSFSFNARSCFKSSLQLHVQFNGPDYNRMLSSFVFPRVFSQIGADGEAGETILSRHALWWCDEMITLERWLTKGEIYSTGGNST